MPGVDLGVRPARAGGEVAGGEEVGVGAVFADAEDFLYIGSSGITCVRGEIAELLGLGVVVVEVFAFGAGVFGQFAFGGEEGE